ncbi:MAG: type II toxin-antitoxin system VapC family toxin [Clostridiales Family XIII bacterium]|jgi:tRNA(fMet)-specific endonuclease VapC|nr:type II toxin-antitoxin system VapC family toxin [Clostridiales Family XIII bacterium]
MTYLLDTNICIFTMKQVPGVVERFRSARKAGIAISSVTLAELEFGVYNSKAPERNRNALLAFSTLVKILPFDIPASSEYGKIRAALGKAGTPIGALDTLIAAHAKSLKLILVTNNTREFRRVEGLFVEDWPA